MTIYERPRAELFAQDAPSNEIKPFDAWLRGLGIAFVESGGFPEMNSFNGLLQSLNGYIKYLEQSGFAAWRNDLEYPVGAGVRAGAIWYRAKTQNTNKQPSTSQNDWSVFLNANDLSFTGPLQILNGVVSIKDASQTQKGAIQFANNTEIAGKQNVGKAVNPSNVATIAQTTDFAIDQIARNLASVRYLGTTYTNDTSKGITLFVEIVNTFSYLSSEECTLTFGGADIKFSGGGFNTQGAKKVAHITMPIPPNTTYRVTSQTSGTIATWVELR